jgi:hypothetical protein
MQRFVKAVRKSVEDANWYSALSLALLLPDLCGYLEAPKDASAVRYARWFQQWLGPTYSVVSRYPGEGTRVFLSGNDCYALRCALSHQGADDITAQRAQQVIEKFQFVASRVGRRHMNLYHDDARLMGTVSQLEVSKRGRSL